jgi:archaellum component FlaD/FlaE
VDGKYMDKQEMLTSELLEKELFTLVEKKIISQRIADKIKHKVQIEKLLISQADLIKLIDHMQFLLSIKTSKEHDHQFSNRSIQNKDMPHNPDSSLILKHNNSLDDTLQKEISETEKNIENVKDEQKKYVHDQETNVHTQKDMILENHLHSIAPFSEFVNDPEHIIVLFKWLQYLIDKIGNEQLPTILSYYVDIDWISKNVYTDLLRYAKGITFEGDEKTKPYHPLSLTTRDHLQSFFFIQKLKGTSLTEDFLFKIDNELEQLERTLNYYQDHIAENKH